MLKLAIDVFTHFFKVSEPDPKLQMHLTEFVKAYFLETTLEYVEGRWVRLPGRVFAARTKDKREYRFHIHSLETFKTYFAGRGYEVFVEHDETKDIYPGDEANFHKPKGFALRDYQIPISKYILEPGYSKVVELHMGGGKGFRLDTLVRLKNDWVPIKDIRVGDEVLTPSGDAAKIIGVFDNKNMDCYRVMFEDGRHCTCDDEHLWKVYDGNRFVVLPMKDILTMDYMRLSIPLIDTDSSKDVLYVTASLNDIGTISTQLRGMGLKVSVEQQQNRYLVKGYRDSDVLSFKSIEYDGKHDTRCIKVDHPDEMYVIQDYICTHNTSTTLWTASEYKKKLCIFVLGRYTERWWDDVGLWMDADKILEIRGSLELEEVLRQSDTPFIRDKQMFVMTITTFSDYCTKWEIVDAEKRKEMVPPELVWEALGVGMRITDETHQHFQQNFLADLYTHLPKTVYLSATLNPGDGFIRKMYETMLPIEKRVGGGLQRKYTNVYAMFYRFRLPHLIRCNNRKRMYNHTEFEKWLMRNPKTLENYFSMIDEIIEDRFIAVRKPGQKQLIFFGTKKMCEKYVQRLKKRFSSLDCRKYVSEDKYENLLKADIACSTLGSSGTAVDIPNLLRCLMTVALKSEQANLQALGRLRYMEDQVEFDYLVCTDIPKHRDYHYKKKKLFKDWVKLHQELYTEKTL